MKKERREKKEEKRKKTDEKVNSSEGVLSYQFLVGTYT